MSNRIRISRALGVKGIPTESVMEQAPPKVSPALPETHGQLSGFLDKRSEEVKALEACRNYWGNTVGDKDFASLMEAIVAIRRMYVVAYRELQAVIKTKADAPAVFADFCVQYASYAASMPFSEHALMQSILGPVLEQLATIVDKHSAIEAELDKKAKLEKAQTSLPFGIVHTSSQESDAQPRASSLVLVGMSGPVFWLIDKIVKNVLAADASNNVIRFMTTTPSRDVQSSNLLCLGGSAWEGCTNSDRVMDIMIKEYIANRISGDIDLIVCDNLAKANTTGFIGRADAAKGGDAHKRLRTWANKLGAGIIGAIITDEARPDVSSPAYEQLRTFAQLRQVSIIEDGDNYRITVGTNPQAYVVPKHEVEAFKRSTLIV